VTKETAVQNIKSQLKSSTENDKIEDIKKKPVHGQFYWDLGRASVDKKNLWRGNVARD
jgi:hypothetical protein